MFSGTDLCFPTMPTDIIDLPIGWWDKGKSSAEVLNKVAGENAVKMFKLE